MECERTRCYLIEQSISGHEHLASCPFATCTRDSSADSPCDTMPRSRRPFRHHHSVAWTRFLTLCLLALVTPILADTCKFPPEWNGAWFQKGVKDPIRISDNEMSEKGTCRQSQGDKYLLENKQERCVRCMVINEKHANVLQYKETYCFPKKSQSLKEVCSEINGDASLYSLFRLETTQKVPCPFKGPFKFSYSRGHGECRDPLSSIDACTDDAHLLFRFQACADVQGSESRVEELECLGEWKEGSVRYLVGKLQHLSAPVLATDEDKFRCFVFEKLKDDSSYQIAQSGDATCDGIFSPTEGSRTMKLSRSEPVGASCAFPSWLWTHKHWRTLDGLQFYDFSRNDTFRVFNNTNGQAIRHATCSRQDNFPSKPYTQFVVHSVSGCKVGFTCIRIYLRSDHIMEIEAGTHLTKNKDDACYDHHFSSFLTLTTFAPELKACPLEGVYAVDAPEDEEESSPLSPGKRSSFVCSEQSVLTSRCQSAEHMQLRSKCSPSSDLTNNLYCNGEWEENGVNYLIVTSSEDKMQYCINYDAKDSRPSSMTINSATCPRPASHTGVSAFPQLNYNYNQAQRGAVTFSLVSQGVCHSVSGSNSALHIIHFSFLLKLHFSLLLFSFLCKVVGCY